MGLLKRAARAERVLLEPFLTSSTHRDSRENKNFWKFCWFCFQLVPVQKKKQKNCSVKGTKSYLHICCFNKEKSKTEQMSTDSCVCFYFNALHLVTKWVVNLHIRSTMWRVLVLLLLRKCKHVVGRLFSCLTPPALPFILNSILFCVFRLWVSLVSTAGHFFSASASDYVHFEHWNLIWMVCVWT